MGWLVMLKNSERKTRLNLSVNGKFLNKEKSSLRYPGPGICPGVLPSAAAPFKGRQLGADPVIGVSAPGVPPNWHACEIADGFPIQKGP